MREILFGAKAVNRDKGYHRTKYKNGDWVYGLVTRLYDKRFENLPAEMTDINGISGIEVDYKTIRQYTGRTDKHCKKAFDGDIVKTPRFPSDLWKIKWSERDSCYYLESCKNGCLLHFTEITNILPTDWEIIENIYDNPELLSGDGGKESK